MHIVQKGHDWTGYSWWIQLWGKRGLRVNFYTSSINIRGMLDLSWAEECRYLHLQVMNTDWN